jgi:hypothetical protein
MGNCFMKDKKLSKDSNQISNNNNNNNNIEDSSRTKSSNFKNQATEPQGSPHLPLHIIDTILVYFNDTEYRKALLINKKLNQLMNNKIVKRIASFSHDKTIGDKLDMNEVYCELRLSEYVSSDVDALKKVRIKFETKDQGWASVNCSSILLRFIDNNTKNKVIEITLAQNFKEKYYKKVQLVIDSKNKAEMFKYLKDRDLKMQLVAKSVYPGWQCYLRDVVIEFLNYKINR